MKRKELYNYVREEIINELTTETTYAGKGSVEAIKKDPKFATLNTSAKTNAINDLTKGGDVELEEMARKGTNIKAGENFSSIKDIYAGSIIGQILDTIEKAGEEGVTSKEIMMAVGIKNPPQLNPIMRELADLGAITGAKSEKPEPEAAAEPEVEVPVEEPSAEEPDMEDDWEKPEEEEPSPEGPSAADIAAAEKEATKIAGAKGYAEKLSPEDEEKYNKLKKGIDAKVAKLLKMKKSQVTSSDDFKILKQLISRDDVKKLFKAKGVNLKDILSDITG